MADDSLQKAVSLLEKSEHIGILLPAEPSTDTLAAVEVLMRILKVRGKLVGLLADAPGMNNSHEPFTTLAASQKLPKELIISLDTTQTPASRVRYEKDGSELRIVLSPDTVSIARDAFSFRDGAVECDAAIAVGIENIESVSSDYMGPDFFTTTPIIAIDTSLGHTGYGEVNLVDQSKASVSEIVYELISQLTQAPLEAPDATLLLAGITARTRAFADPDTGADTLLAASELVRLGASLADAQALGGGTASFRIQQLAGRATVRSRIDEERGIVWSFLTAEDFEKTGSSGKDTGAVMNTIETRFPAHRIAALLWQEHPSARIRATLGGAHALLDTLAASGIGSFQSPWLLLASQFESFRDAEVRVQSLIEKNIPHDGVENT